MQLARSGAFIKAFLDEIKTPAFWLQRALAHPCCWLPIVSGGSLRLIDTHNLALEVFLGLSLVLLIEELVRIFYFQCNRRSCTGTLHQSRLAAYLIAVPLFFLSFGISHYFFPHGSAHDHKHTAVSHQEKHHLHTHHHKADTHGDNGHSATSAAHNKHTKADIQEIRR